MKNSFCIKEQGEKYYLGGGKVGIWCFLCVFCFVEFSRKIRKHMKLLYVFNKKEQELSSPLFSY